ncbi:hypothetical protein GLOIN_2v658314 [Rhizophagus clarus]|uniref:Uncharacterized protein n=1 Tax=Rhizophagus clarus TaxID=94130 RepID=A0A8H3R238_9GLOM|nr:hypothetical protein GLOIN_2v658314 [Rhizophagus clarus]
MACIWTIYTRASNRSYKTETWEGVKSQGIKLPFKVEHTADIGGKVSSSRAFMSSVNFEGKIYVFSGQNADNAYVNSFNILDTLNGKFVI